MADHKSSSRRYLLNGKFLSRPLTGVDRIAYEFANVFARSSCLAHSDYLAIDIVVSRVDTKAHERGQALAVGDVSLIKAGIGSGRLWEQLSLLLYRPKNMLLSLCNMGPIFRRSQFLMVADAQFITQPHSYRRVFRWYLRVTLPIACRISRHIGTISDHSLRQLEEFGVFPKGKGHVIHCGSDHVEALHPDNRVLQSLGLESGSYFLMVGSIAPHKNVQFVLDQVSGRLPTGAKVVVVGGQNNSIFKTTSQPTRPDVLFAGRITDEELIALYQSARALVFPSITEGFGLPPVEAMRLGCPVIASTGGAIPEVCGDAAVFADPTDGAQWLSTMRRVWADDALCQRLKEAGKRRAQEFTWERAARQIVEIVEMH